MLDFLENAVSSNRPYTMGDVHKLERLHSSQKVNYHRQASSDRSCISVTA